MPLLLSPVDLAKLTQLLAEARVSVASWIGTRSRMTTLFFHIANYMTKGYRAPADRVRS